MKQELYCAINQHIGNRLRLLRKKEKMSQKTLGSLLNLTFQQIQKYEKGTTSLNIDKLCKICQIFNVPLNFFFEDSDVFTLKLLVSQNNANKAFTNEELQLLAAFNNITNKTIAKQLLNLTILLSKTNPNDNSL